MAKFTNKVVTAWLVSAVLVGVASAANGDGGSKTPLFGRLSRNNAKTTVQNNNDNGNSNIQRTLSSWPWVNPGGATPEPRVLGKDDDELETSEVSVSMSQSSALLEKQGRDYPLFRDIDILTDILLDIVKEEDENIHDLYFEFLKYGQERYAEVVMCRLKCC
jgi:hypothetical protein